MSSTSAGRMAGIVAQLRQNPGVVGGLPGEERTMAEAALGGASAQDIAQEHGISVEAVWTALGNAARLASGAGIRSRSAVSAATPIRGFKGATATPASARSTPIRPTRCPKSHARVRAARRKVAPDRETSTARRAAKQRRLRWHYSQRRITPIDKIEHLFYSHLTNSAMYVRVNVEGVG